MDDADRPARHGAQSPRRRIDAACDRFEAAWRTGPPPRIEDSLGELPEPDRPELFRELLAVELELRRGSGERPEPGEYRTRFPVYAGAVDSAFETPWTSDGRPVEPGEPGPPPGAASRPVDGPTGMPDAPGPVDSALGLPERIGRYRVERVLGEGAFGRVYLAHDDALNRPVAIKVPPRNRASRPEDVEAYLGEARMLARLDHPHIVPVHDVGRTDKGLCYIVSKFIEGSDLAHRIKEHRPPHALAAELVATVAEALHYAHSRGLVHRDIKPANILIDAAGKPYVADFGLALKEEDFGKGRRFAGTPAYMSPEQARGEGHRVDRRSDLFGLGIVFYELLAGTRPFRGGSAQEILDQIVLADPRPPRQLDHRIPRELERICLKALSRRSSDRYGTARDMAEDLRFFLKDARENGHAGAGAAAGVTPTSSTTPVGPDAGRRSPRVVPKGLRSFDEHDADFFLELLPGPRGRDGLPESLRFWKLRIEERAADHTFRVGLLYGPSGCGKSSLVRAGLLPRLASHVATVYVEATPEETESRLLKGLRNACPGLPPHAGLVESLASLRRGEFIPAGQKLLVVLDQFEQWLHAHRALEGAGLVAALRQCDGERVQAIVMVRDDFWMASTRFLRELEVSLVEGQNSAAVDLFQERHARKVLAAFGQAFGALPDRLDRLAAGQHAFLDRAILGLAQDGKVIPVRLALLAEMVKEKPWLPATLKDMGGVEGVGLTFLQETFDAATAPPAHLFHQKAARSVLKALLPDSGTDLKGHMRSYEELHEASGYLARPEEFADLLRILDGELRLITPTDPEGVASEGGEAPSPKGKCYQLAHDYIVPSLKEWLTRKQRETARGRAELRLSERAALWNARPEDRHLPSVWEAANIRLLTKKTDWTPPERRMMRWAGRLHGVRALLAFLLLAAATRAGLAVRERVMATQAAGLVQRLFDADTAQVPGIVAAMQDYRRWVDPPLRREFQQAAAGSPRQLHASLALLPVDTGQVDTLYRYLLSASPFELPVICRSLHEQQRSLAPRLWTVLGDPQADRDQCFRAACALADVVAEDDARRWDAASRLVTDRLLAAILKNPSHYSPLVETLRPARARLLAPLSSTLRDKERPDSELSLATSLLADYARERPDVLADALIDVEAKHFAILFDSLRSHPDRAGDLLESVLAKAPSKDATDDEIDQLAQRQARAAIALVRLGRPKQAWERLQHSPDPTVRSYLVNWLKPLGVEPIALATQLAGIGARAAPIRAVDRFGKDDPFFDPEKSERRALILALGEYDARDLPAGERERLVARLLDAYRDDPDAGIHGAAEWTLRRWKREKVLDEADADLQARKGWGDRRWFVNGEGQTLVVIEGPVEYAMGSPPTEPDHTEPERSHQERIDRRFALAVKEVTVEQYRRSGGANARPTPSDPVKDNLDPHAPRVRISWYAAAAYCNWLSRREGLGEDQWCYEPNAVGEYAEGMKIVAGFRKRTGYRLPTEAEWEYACRAGAVTSRPFGRSAALLGKYGWTGHDLPQSARLCGLLKPNDLGCFDMLGNVYEWCQDAYGPYPAGAAVAKGEDAETVTHLEENSKRTFRGGAFSTHRSFVRSAFRNGDPPSYQVSYRGFRVARTYP